MEKWSELPRRLQEGGEEGPLPRRLSRLPAVAKEGGGVGQRPCPAQLPRSPVRKLRRAQGYRPVHTASCRVPEAFLSLEVSPLPVCLHPGPLGVQALWGVTGNSSSAFQRWRRWQRQWQWRWQGERDGEKAAKAILSKISRGLCQGQNSVSQG